MDTYYRYHYGNFTDNDRMIEYPFIKISDDAPQIVRGCDHEFNEIDGVVYEKSPTTIKMFIRLSYWIPVSPIIEYK